MMHLIRIRKLYGSMMTMDNDTFCDKVKREWRIYQLSSPDHELKLYHIRKSDISPSLYMSDPIRVYFPLDASDGYKTSFGC